MAQQDLEPGDGQLSQLSDERRAVSQMLLLTPAPIQSPCDSEINSSWETQRFDA